MLLRRERQAVPFRCRLVVGAPTAPIPSGLDEAIVEGSASRSFIVMLARASCWWELDVTTTMTNQASAGARDGRAPGLASPSARAHDPSRRVNVALGSQAVRLGLFAVASRCAPPLRCPLPAFRVALRVFLSERLLGRVSLIRASVAHATRTVPLIGGDITCVRVDPAPCCLGEIRVRVVDPVLKILDAICLGQFAVTLGEFPQASGIGTILMSALSSIRIADGSTIIQGFVFHVAQLGCRIQSLSDKVTGLCRCRAIITDTPRCRHGCDSSRRLLICQSESLGA